MNMRTFLLFRGEMTFVYLKHFCSVMKIHPSLAADTRVHFKCLSQDRSVFASFYFSIPSTFQHAYLNVNLSIVVWIFSMILALWDFYTSLLLEPALEHVVQRNIFFWMLLSQQEGSYVVNSKVSLSPPCNYNVQLQL